METQTINKDFRNLTVGDMVASDYRKAEVFRNFGIDFCCGGKATLQEVCDRKGIDTTALLHALDRLEQAPVEETVDVNSWDVRRLIDHIIDKHHSYVNKALPILNEYGQKVARVHGGANPEVVEILAFIRGLTQEMRMHMHKEEMILFPYVKQLASAKEHGESMHAPPFGTVQNPVRMMEAEHESAGNAMAGIRELSNDYSPPEHACNTYRVLYAKLEEFESDLHRHVHLENNILFPRAIALEEALTG